MKHRSVVVAAAGLLVAVQLAMGGVLPNSSGARAGAAGEYPERTVYVDGRSHTATNSGPGSSSTPFRTIQQAINVAEANNVRRIATTIVVRPGVYRETLMFEPSNQQTGAPIVLTGPSSNDVVVSATNVWKGWTPRGGGVYGHNWPFHWGLAPIPPGWEDAGVTPIIRRHETLFVNGALQRQVLSLSALHATPGAFYVSESDHTVYIKPARRVNMKRALVEVGVRPKVLQADGSQNLTIRNLRFRGATTAFAPAAQLYQVTNVLLDHVTFGWNNWTGFESYGSTNVTVRNSTFDHNGAMGISGNRNHNIVFDHDQNSFNNWRGAWGGMTLWENGMKMSLTRGAHFTYFVAVGNLAPGLWLDTDNQNVTIDHSTFEHNAVDGIFLEANQGPVTLRDNLSCGNGRGGIFDGRTNNVTVEGNRVFDNGRAQLLFSGAPLSRSVTDYITGVTTDVRSVGWTVRDNHFAGSGSQMLVGGWGIPSSAWSVIASRLDTQDNSFDQHGAADPFWVPGINRAGRMSDWVSASGEHGSSFTNANPSLVCK